MKLRLGLMGPKSLRNFPNKGARNPYTNQEGRGKNKILN
jgi:hypothetical protein